MEKAERRDQILRTAKTIFARKGYHDAGIDDIVKQAKIARGTFYLYFDGKRDVFGTLLDELVEQLDEAIRPVELGPGKPDPLAQVRDNVRRVIDIVSRDPERMQLLVHQATSPDRQSRETRRRFYERIRAMIERSLHLGVGLGLLRKADTRIVSSCVLGMIKEIVEEVTEGRTFDPEKLVDEVVRFGLGGILRTGS